MIKIALSCFFKMVLDEELEHMIAEREKTGGGAREKTGGKRRLTTE